MEAWAAQKDRRGVRVHPGTADTYVGQGLVGGYIYDFEAEGARAARIVIRVLRGERPVNIPVTEQDPSHYVFDARQLRRWGIDEARLPAASMIRFREPSVWDRYRWRIVGGIVLVVVQSALIAGLLAHRARSRRAQIARRQAEDQVRHGRDELAHALRMSTLGELSGAIAHELGQPLAAIVVNAQASRRMLEGKRATPSELDEALSDITADAVRAGQVLQRLRRLVRKDPAEFQSIDPAVLIRDTLLLLRGDIRLKKITVAVTLPDDPLPRIFGDSIQLQQVLMNLVINASEAIAAVAEGPREITIDAGAEEPGLVRISVSDTGPGLEELDLERVFAPFVTSKPGGLGMGLSISRSIVEAHQGRIWATRQPTRGSAMHMMLPCAIDGRAASDILREESASA